MTTLLISRRFACELFYDHPAVASDRLFCELQDMRRQIVSELPLASSQICFFWSWYLDVQSRRVGLPNVDSILREDYSSRGRNDRTITIELRATNEAERSPVSTNIPILTAKDRERLQRHLLIQANARLPKATPQQLENMSKLSRCVYNAHSPHIKCAVNPAIACSECTHFEEEQNGV